jgi:hypothetical protein
MLQAAEAAARGTDTTTHQKEMTMQEETTEAKMLNRRDAIRITGAAMFSTGFMTTLVRANDSSVAAADPSRAQASPAQPQSVFLDKCKCNNDGKYNTLDKKGLSPLIAFWLMLTTENWEPCWSPGLAPDQSCKDSAPKKTPAEAKAWRDALAKELNLAPEYVDYLYKQAHDGGKMQDAFERVRGLFQAFIQSPQPPKAAMANPSLAVVYGGHPCLGGATLLQIAKMPGS